MKENVPHLTWLCEKYKSSKSN